MLKLSKPIAPLVQTPSDTLAHDLSYFLLDIDLVSLLMKWYFPNISSFKHFILKYKLTINYDFRF
jgi:hypothetical protein